MKPAYGRLLLALSLLLLLPAPAVMAQDPPPITAQNVSQLAPVLEIPLPYVNGLSWQDDATLAVSTSAGGTYYQLDTGEATITPFSPYRHIFSPDGRLVLELDRSGYFEPEYTFRLYDAPTGEILVTRGGHFDWLSYRNAVFTPDGAGIIFYARDDNGRQQRIAYADVTGLLDGTAGLEEILTFDERFNGPFQFSRFSQPDDLIFALGGVDDAVNIWRLEDIHQLATTPPLTTLVLENSYTTSYLFTGPDELVTWKSMRDEGLIRWWNINTGAMQREVVIEFDHQFEEIRAISPDAHYALVYRWPEARCELWDLTLDQALPGALPDSAHVAFSPDGRRLAYLDDYGILTWMEIATGEKHTVVGGYNRSVDSIVFNADNDLLRIDYYLSSTSGKNALELWDIPSRRNILSLFDTQSAFSPDGQTLVAGGSDGILRFYDGHSGEVIRTLADARFDAPFAAIAFHPEGQWLACSLLNGAFFLIDLQAETIHMLAPGTVDYRPGVFVPLFSPDGHTLAAQVYRSGMIYVYLWDVTTRRPILDNSPSRMILGRMLFSPDGAQLVLGGLRLLGAIDSGCITVYDTRTGEMLTRMGSGYLMGELPDLTTAPYYGKMYIDNVTWLGFHPDGNFLAAASGDQIALWNVPLAAEYRIGIDVADAGVHEMAYAFTLPGRSISGIYPADVFDVAFHPTQPALAFASRDGHVYLWDMADPDHVRATALESVARSLDFSPDGALLAVGGAEIAFWETATLAPLQPPPDDLAGLANVDVQFSPDGRYLLTQDGMYSYMHKIVVWGVSP